MLHGRETLRTVLGPSKNDTTVVLGGASAGGVGAFNAVEWLLDTFEQVRYRFDPSPSRAPGDARTLQ